MRRLIASFGLAIAAAAAGCSSDGGTGCGGCASPCAASPCAVRPCPRIDPCAAPVASHPTPGIDAGAAAGPTGPAEPRKAGHTVEIRDMEFSPETLTILQGEKVTWVNHDVVEHTVTREAPPFFDLRVAPGDERSYTFTSVSDAAGFEYVCAIHARMHRGHVVVLPQVQAIAGEGR